MKKAFESLLILAIASAIVLSAFQPVFAEGLFETKCPQCNGSRKTSSTSTCTTCNGSGETSSTSTCSTCKGSGDVYTTSTCTQCKGSGETMIWQTCSTCYGSGDIAPTITRKSRSGWLQLVGLDWVARVQGVFHNEEDTGTYFIATSEVHTVTEIFYHSSSRTYIAPHADVTITIDTPEIEWLTDWTYNIYVSSKDDITCPVCDGSGGQSVLATCSACSGVGSVTTVKDCATCDGVGEITTVQDCSECDGIGEITTVKTCTLCKGTGYITNQSAVNLAIVAVAIVVIGAVLGAAFAFSRRRKLVPPK